ERSHAMKFYHYLADRGMSMTISGYDLHDGTYTSILHSFETALEHEKEVTKRIYHISDIALDEREHATIQFLKWFIDEQVEEESSFDKHIHKLKHIQNDPSAMFMMDEELGNRTFVDNTQEA